MMGRRMMRRRAIVGTAATVSMVSSARRNRAERKAIEQQTQANEGAENVQYQAPQSDMTTQLQELKGLLDSGVITQAEFDSKKKQILGI